MAQTSFEENMNSRKVRQPLDDARSIDRSRGSEGTRVTIDRIKKWKKSWLSSTAPMREKH